MLSSISPLGERARRQRYSTTAAAYLLASIAGGASIGTVAGTLGRIIRVGTRPSDALLAALVAAACILATVLDLWSRRLRLPTVRRQVNEDWLVRYRGWVYGGAFGFQLGLGIVTIVTTAAVYTVLVVSALVGSITLGAIVGAAFGLARALPLLLVARVRDAGELRSLHRRLQSWARPVQTITVGSLATAAVVAGVLATRELSWLA